MEGQVACLHRQQEAPAGIRAALQVAVEVFAERQLEAWGTAEQRLAGGRPGGVELLAVEQHHVAEGALDIPQQVAGGGIGVAVAGIALEDLEGHQQAHQSMDALGIGTDRGGQRLVAVDPALDQIGQPEARSDVDATGLPFPGNNLYQITRSSKIRIIHLLFSLVTHFRNPRSTQALYFALLARSARNTAEHPGSFGTLRKMRSSPDQRSLDLVAETTLELSNCLFQSLFLRTERIKLQLGYNLRHCRKHQLSNPAYPVWHLPDLVVEPVRAFCVLCNPHQRPGMLAI